MKELIGAILLVLAAIHVCSAETSTAYKTIAYEASGEELLGQVMVAKVIQNRMVERNKTADEVCLQPWQFSCWNDGVQLKERTTKELNTAKKAWTIAKGINSQVNLYHHKNISPYWSKAKNVYYIETIGNHKFYYEER